VSDDIKAIDIMNYLFTKQGMDIFWGGPEMQLVWRDFIRRPDLFSKGMTTEQFVKQMDEAGYEKVFIAALKMGSYRQRTLNMDYTNEMVYEEMKKFPDRLVGIAGYDPFYIMDSLKAIEKAVKEYGFKGIYVHSLGFGMGPDDRRLYPCYVKCIELDIPFSMQIGHSFEALTSEPGRPINVDQVALDFPELKFVGSHTGVPWAEEMIAMAWKHVNVYMGVDAHRPSTLPPNVVQFMDSGRGRHKCLFGTNNTGLKLNKGELLALPIKDETKKAVLHDNAMRLYKL